MVSISNKYYFSFRLYLWQVSNLRLIIKAKNSPFASRYVKVGILKDSYFCLQVERFCSLVRAYQLDERWGRPVRRRWLAAPLPRNSLSCLGYARKWELRLIAAPLPPSSSASLKWGRGDENFINRSRLLQELCTPKSYGIPKNSSWILLIPTGKVEKYLIGFRLQRCR